MQWIDLLYLVGPTATASAIAWYVSQHSDKQPLYDCQKEIENLRNELKRVSEALEVERSGKNTLMEQLRKEIRANQIAASELDAVRMELKLLKAQIQNTGHNRDRPDEFEAPFVLGVWPDVEQTTGKRLQYRPEIEAIFNTGYRYSVLDGNVTQEAIVTEFNLSERVDILHVGSEGHEEGILLSNGTVASPGWWGRLSFIRDLKLIVIMSCHSQTVADRLYTAGVPAVVGVRGDIPDADAVKFTVLFYRWLSADHDVQDAVNLAIMSMPSRANDDILVRGNWRFRF